MKSVPPKTVNPKALATTWIVALAVVLAFEAWARAKPSPVWKREEEQLVEYQTAKLERLAGGEVLLLGDSALGNDVDAKVLARELGRPALNLALVASFTTIGDYYLLEKALASGKKPSAVVLFHTMDLWPRPLDDGFYAVVQRGTGNAGLESFARSLAYRSALAEQARAWRLTAFEEGRGLAWNPEEAPMAVAKAARAARELPLRDYIPVGATIDWAAREANWARGAMTPSSFDPKDPRGAFSVDRHVDLWLDATLDLAAAHGVPVYVGIAPTWRPKVLRAENRAFARDLMQWLEAQSEHGTRFRRLWTPTLVVDGAALGDKAEHLAPAAMEPFTRWLAARLRAVESGTDPNPPRGEFWDPIADAPVTPP
ncbi:MAG: hypothetical protein HZA53_11660 [Planctomycetes bacterium]|nr:hypothetical protein [Planctomycetota bacterium]